VEINHREGRRVERLTVGPATRLSKRLSPNFTPNNPKRKSPGSRGPYWLLLEQA